MIAEYENGAAVGFPSREYIYGGAALLAKIAGSTTTYYHQDHLSNRLVTDSSGNTYAQMGTYPFGYSWYNATNDKLMFTTYERDAESGNDYAMARTYINRVGRFSSLDPLSGSTSDPQSLDGYTYTGNEPVDLIDPSGAKYRLTAIFGSLDASGEGSTDSMGALGFFEALAMSQIPTITLYEFRIDDPSALKNNPNPTLAQALSLANGEGLTFLGSVQVGGDFLLSLNSSMGGNTSGGPQTQLSPQAQACENKIQGAVNNALNTNSTYLGPTTGPGMSPMGYRNGAYNFNYFAPGVRNPVLGSTDGSGRFPGSGLHIPLPGGADPTITPWGYSPSAGGSYFTAHFDSANPLDDLFGFFKHLINDVILRRPHGC